MSEKLFTPLKVGNNELQHRVIMAPLTRLRCDKNWVPTDLVKEYYVQRAAVPGTMIITEGTHISPQHIGIPFVGGIWNQEQVQAWKKITDAVHEKKSFIWCQLWHMGRCSNYETARSLGSNVWAPSAIPLNQTVTFNIGYVPTPEGDVPTAMTEDDIKNVITTYVQAAKNAIAAGFDGIQLHSANGYLVDQFLQDVTNHRTDRYGGSIENRSRFAHEVLKALVDAVGAERVGVRFSPWGAFGEVGMADPVPQFHDIIKKASALSLAFLDLVEPRISGTEDQEYKEGHNNEILVEAWTNGHPVFLSGGMNSKLARERVDAFGKQEAAVVVGRYFISNPDLPYRFKHHLPLTPYERSKFYIVQSPEGYVTYEFSDEFLAEHPEWKEEQKKIKEWQVKTEADAASKKADV